MNRSKWPVATPAGLGGARDYLENTARSAFVYAAGLIDHATSGSRGKYATIALNMANLTTDKQAISHHYGQHPEVIDRYFEYVDVGALARLVGAEKTVTKNLPRAALKAGSLVAAGILLGAGGLGIYHRKKRTQ